LCWIAARTQDAVPSGRSVKLSPFNWSMKVYISFSTISVTSPIARTNRSVFSRIGTRILR
jgi:hypothetical protein